MEFRDDFREILNKKVEEGEIFSWQANFGLLKRNNVYITKDNKIESVLEGNREELGVTIFRDFDDFIGESSFSVFLDATSEDFEKELNDAIYIAEFSRSKKYELPNAEDEMINDSHIDYSIFYNEDFITDFNEGVLDLKVKEKLERLYELISEENEKGSKLILNSCEVFNKIGENYIETHSGIKKNVTKTSSYMELIITGVKEDESEIEHIVYEKINDFYSYDFEEFFVNQIKYVKDKISSVEAPNFSGKVILSDFAAKDFFMPEPPNNKIIMHAMSRFKYLGISNFEIGEELIDAKYDKLTIFSNPLLKLNMSSSPYDSMGISAKKVCLVKDNIFQNFFASKQYGDYLGIKPTGPFGVVEVLGGEKTSEDLFNDEEKRIEIISFAWFNPDIVSGDFSAEIRLGYIVENGKKTPFKGGLFSGNIMEVCREVELSSNLQNKPEYFGPKTIKFYKGKIISG